MVGAALLWALIKLVVKAHAARAALEAAPDRALADISTEHGISRDYLKVPIRLSWLAPDITSAILDGRQAATLTRQRLARIPNLPIG